MSAKAPLFLIIALLLAQVSAAQDVLSPNYGRAPAAEQRPGASRGQTAGTSRQSESSLRLSTPGRTSAVRTEGQETPFDFDRTDRLSSAQGNVQAGVRSEMPRQGTNRGESASGPPGRAMAAIEPANLTLSRGEEIRAQHLEQDAQYDAVQVSHAESAEERVPALSITPRRGDEVAHDVATRAGASTGALSGWGSLPGVMASLGFVLGLFFLVAWLMRRGMPGTIPTLSKSVVEVLGRVPMAGRQQMQLLRVGNKLILIHLSLTGAETLTEIDDPAEVDRIAGLCQQGQNHSSTRVFHDMLDQLGREERAAEFVDQDHGLELVSSGRGKRRDPHGRDRRV